MSLSNLLFLKEVAFDSMMVFEGKSVPIYSAKNEINRIAKLYFFSIKEYRKLVRKELILKNKIPIYFSKSLLLFCVKSKDEVYWINYFKILKICFGEKVVIFFMDGSFIEVEVSRQVLSKEIKKVNVVLDYINNLWNDSVFIDG